MDSAYIRRIIKSLIGLSLGVSITLMNLIQVIGEAEVAEGAFKMKVKELIELLSKTNQDATVIVDEDWTIKSIAEKQRGEAQEYAKLELLDYNISEVEESDDKTYVRIW